MLTSVEIWGGLKILPLVKKSPIFKVVFVTITGSQVSWSMCTTDRRDWEFFCKPDGHVWDQVDPAVPLQPKLGNARGGGGGEVGLPLADQPGRKHQGAQCRANRGGRQLLFNVQQGAGWVVAQPEVAISLPAGGALFVLCISFITLISPAGGAWILPHSLCQRAQ